jgi:hypothetical protein
MGVFCALEGAASACLKKLLRQSGPSLREDTQDAAHRHCLRKGCLEAGRLLQFVKLRYRPDAIQWEYPQLVTDLSRSTPATALIVDRAARARPCARRLGITVSGRCLHSPVDSEGTP